MTRNSGCCGQNACGTNAASRPVTHVPAVRVYEGEDAFQLVAEVPGADDQSTEVSIEGDILTVSAGMSSSEPEGARLAYAEFRTGCYQRSFELSDAVDRQGIEASVCRGVLTVRLPKARAVQPQKVPVIAG